MDTPPTTTALTTYERIMKEYRDLYSQYVDHLVQVHNINQEFMHWPRPERLTEIKNQLRSIEKIIKQLKVQSNEVQRAYKAAEKEHSINRHILRPKKKVGRPKRGQEIKLPKPKVKQSRGRPKKVSPVVFSPTTNK